MSHEIPTSHPRYLSLLTRERIVEGVENGITSLHGLIAQGRGEAWDYLFGERTCDFAHEAIEAAAAMLLLARHPVVSVNGNVAALVPDDIVSLGKAANAPLEVNIFHGSKNREKKIERHLYEHGADGVLMPSPNHAIDFIDHNRKFVHPDGILQADVVFVPLEDGDRCEALVKNGKHVITVDLNPLSRTALAATITIVDNIVRSTRLLADRIIALRDADRVDLTRIVEAYDNRAVLLRAKAAIGEHLAG